MDLRRTRSWALLLAGLAVAATGCNGGEDGSTGTQSSGTGGAGAGTAQSSSSTGPGGGSSGTGIAAEYPGDIGLDSNPAVLFFEDFEDPDVASVGAAWSSADPNGLSLTADVPAGAVSGSQSLMTSLSTAGGVTLYKSLPVQQGAVHVRYYAKYSDPTNYHHTGMWFGGYNPPTDWPQGTAGIRPSGSDFFHSAWEPMNSGLGMDHYTQWPGMDCFMEPGGCWGNVFLRNNEPAAAGDTWICFEVMLKPNTPGQSDGELAVWMNDGLVQHLQPGSPTFNRLGNGVWEPDPNGTPFPGFNWRDTPDLGFSFIWLDFYVDGAGSMLWDQVVVATERVGCMTPAG